METEMPSDSVGGHFLLAVIAFANLYAEWRV